MFSDDWSPFGFKIFHCTVPQKGSVCHKLLLLNTCWKSESLLGILWRSNEACMPDSHSTWWFWRCDLRIFILLGHSSEPRTYFILSYRAGVFSLFPSTGTMEFHHDINASFQILMPLFYREYGGLHSNEFSVFLVSALSYYKCQNIFLHDPFSYFYLIIIKQWKINNLIIFMMKRLDILIIGLVSATNEVITPRHFYKSTL